MPWIETGGFDLDLILHAGNVIGGPNAVDLFVGIINGKVHFWDKPGVSKLEKARLLAIHLESVTDILRSRGVHIPDIIFPYAVGSFPTKSTHFYCAQQSLVPDTFATSLYSSSSRRYCNGPGITRWDCVASKYVLWGH